MIRFCKPNCTSRSANPPCRESCQFHIEARNRQDNINAERRKQNAVDGFLGESYIRDVKYRKNMRDSKRYND